MYGNPALLSKVLGFHSTAYILPNENTLNVYGWANFILNWKVRSIQTLYETLQMYKTSNKNKISFVMCRLRRQCRGRCRKKLINEWFQPSQTIIHLNFWKMLFGSNFSRTTENLSFEQPFFKKKSQKSEKTKFFVNLFSNYIFCRNFENTQS
jgi:hypothetical protein